MLALRQGAVTGINLPDMAKLYFYYASMNAGKSTTLLQAEVRQGAQTEIGGNDRYVALCRRHFTEAMDGN